MNNLIFIFLIFIIGIIFYCTNSRSKTIENFQNSSDKNSLPNLKDTNNLPCGAKIPKENCPNVLMRKNNQIYLYNSNLARVPGINPIIFKTLEEYVEFVQWQKSQNIDCPILFLDTTYDTQNNEVYKVTSNPFEQPEVVLQTDLIRPGDQWITPLTNAGRDNPPYNQSPIPPDAFDPNNQYIGSFTPLDKIFQSSKIPSPNPMDPNWGGHSFTQSKIDQGYYIGDLIYPEGENPYIDPDYNNIFRKDATSDNAMDPNWKGKIKTEEDVSKGLYSGDEVYRTGSQNVVNPFLETNLLPRPQGTNF